MATHLAIVNPAAGGGASGKRAPQALQRLRDAGLQIEVQETRAAGDGAKIARAAYQAGQRDFIAVGGDGTSFEVLAGLFGDEDPRGRAPEDRPRLGFLPLGTGNSFLRDFSDRGAEYAIESLIAGRARDCDVIRLTHAGGVVHFINIFSIGFVADVGALRNNRFASFGELGYVIGVIVQTAGLHSYVFPMRVDDGPEDRGEMTFLSVNNSRFTGGKMMMAPSADTGDGLLDIIRVGALSRLSLLQTFPKIFKGTHIHNPAVTTAQARVIDFDIDRPIACMIDGEMLDLQPRRLEVLPGVLQVRA
ncbi:MAG: diacylglycerol kinase family lipid kinase [Myxococcales bacterium]|nr:diacylglycerol kinase family lipid kinase [Myxococcales bacterium]MCB9701607.1 diacylglycerol kinase family lipid kinase [Myxococcales bacterium]